MVCIELPPLRERAEDIPLLLQFFLDRYRKEIDRGPVEITPQAMEVLCGYAAK